MRRSRPLVLAAAGIACLASGCAGSERTPATRLSPSPTAAPVGGQRLFAAACSACHTLQGAGARRTQGGDLAAFRMSQAEVESFTRIMPVRPRLTAAQVRAVSHYVLSAQRAHARR